MLASQNETSEVALSASKFGGWGAIQRVSAFTFYPTNHPPRNHTIYLN